MMPLTNFDINLTTCLAEVANTVFKCHFTTPPRNEVRLTPTFVKELQFVEIFKITRGLSFKLSRNSKACKV